MPVPKNGSKNPVLGFVKCHTPGCVELATVHQPKGNRRHLRYTICPSCGTNQQTGDALQSYIRDNMRETPDDAKTVETALNQGFQPIEPEQSTVEETDAETVETAPEVSESEPEETAAETTETEPAKPISIKWSIVGAFSLLGILLGVSR